LIRNPEKARELEAEHKGSVEHINIDEDVIRLNVLFGKVAGSRGSLYELGEELNDAPTSEAAYAVLEKWERKYQDVNEPLKGVRIAIDGVHTGTGPIAAEVFKRLGAEVHARNLDIRLVTGRHNANLSIDENLANVRETIKSVNADFGMAFDLGGDRGLIVTPDPSTANGFYEIESDEAQVVLLQELKEKWGYDNIPTGFIRDVLGTYALNLIAKKMDVRFDQTDAGYPFLKVRKEVRENEAKAKGERIVFPVFGERSGRIWLHFTGEIENPLAVEILFAAMVRHGKKDLIEQGLAGNDFDAPTAIKIFNEKRIPFTKSKRVQPLFHLDFLKDLESNPENKEIGWTFNGEVGKFKNPPSALIKVGNDIVVKKLKEFFTPGKEFNTPVGVLTVSEFNTERDDGAIGGRHQFADIIFEQNGGVVGRIVFRTSSKDSTFASTYEAPGEGRELHRNSAMGIVFDFLKDNNIALVTTDMLDLLPLTDEQKKDVIAKFNLKFLEEDYISYQRAAGREVAPLLVNQYEIDTGNAYWNGDLTTTPITRPFRASREEDVKDMVTLREQEALLYERLALESLLKGEGYIS
ncbi:MAG: hypothetical protein KAR31_11275, partial [Candidatus Omnitrophica bacterium]|nr:hypothetical protein [Candidatus Omnitrophota bacterium]